MLRKELTPPVFDKALGEASVEYQIKRDQARKNPFILRSIIGTAHAQGHTSRTLEQVVGEVADLVSSK